MKRINKKWIVLIAIILVAGIFLALALGSNTELKEKNNGRVSYGTVLVLILAVAIPILLIALTCVIAFVKDKNPTGAQTAQAAENEALSSQVAPEGETEETGERFCMLKEIDQNKESYRQKSYDKTVTLEELCNNFRNYAASQLRLYYDEADIRRFIAGMAVSHILILQGMSGTGKTSLAHAFGSFIDNSSTIVPVQPMWKERSDLIGYYNEFTKKFNETLLLEKMYEANYSEDMYITVLDEMNIARIEYYFAEFLSLLELPNPDERYIDIVSDKWENDPKQFKDGRLKLPPNMWFIGTANNDDSTFAISSKVYDRAMIMDLDTKSERYTAPKTEKIRISCEQFNKLVAEAQEEYSISKRNMKRIEAFDKYLIEHMHITFGNRIMKQIKTYIPVYVSCGGDELEALDDILSKKVIRKLEAQNPIYLRNSVDGLIEYMDELFGDDNMPMCKEYIRRIERNA